MLGFKINLVFDIDGVIGEAEKVDEETKSFFLEKGAIIVASNREHYIFPGMIELFQFLFDCPEIRIAFFSNAPKERNNEFVEKFLKRCRGEKYKDTEIIIRSNTDLTDKSHEENMELFKLYGISYCSKKKDLKAVFPEELDNTILIDDFLKNIARGQEFNLLYSNHVCCSYFRDLIWDQSKKDFAPRNNAFYLASLLNELIQNVRKGQSVKDALFSLQFIKKEDISSYFSAFYQCTYPYIRRLRSDADNHAIFEKGLEILRQYNSNLEFCTYESFHRVLGEIDSKNTLRI